MHHSIRQAALACGTALTVLVFMIACGIYWPGRGVPGAEPTPTVTTAAPAATAPATATLAPSTLAPTPVPGRTPTAGTFTLLDPSLSRLYVGSVSTGGLDGVFTNGTFLRTQETCSPSFFFTNFVGSLQVSGTGARVPSPAVRTGTGTWMGTIGNTPASGELTLTFPTSATVQIMERIVLPTRSCFGVFTASLTRP